MLAILFLLALISFTGTSDKNAGCYMASLTGALLPIPLGGKEKDKGWILLFNGTSRDGWHG